MKTPDTEKKHQKHCRASLGFVCSCLPDVIDFTVKTEEFTPTTPDTELKETIKEIGIATYGGVDFEPTGMYRDKLTVILNNLLTSRDTYWKERVRKEVEAIRKPEREEPNEMADMKKWEVWDRLTDEDEIYNQALDTLLDNLK